MEGKNNKNNIIIFGFKELILILSIILGLFLIGSIFLFKESTKITFYGAMNDFSNLANETKDIQFKIRAGKYDNVTNEGLSPLSKKIKDDYYSDLNNGTEKVIKSGDVNNCYKEFLGNYEKIYFCLQTYASNVNFIKNNIDILTQEMKILYDIRSCSYSTNYDDFNLCMKNFAYYGDNFFNCLIFKEDELQLECFNVKWLRFLSGKSMLEFFNIEKRKNDLLFKTEANGKIVRKKITSEVIEKHPELLFKYRVFAPVFANFNELKNIYPELFNNKNFLKSLSYNKIIYEKQ